MRQQQQQQQAESNVSGGNTTTTADSRKQYYMNTNMLSNYTYVSKKNNVVSNIYRKDMSSKTDNSNEEENEHENDDNDITSTKLKDVEMKDKVTIQDPSIMKTIDSPAHLNIDPAGPFKSVTLNEIKKMKAIWRNDSVTVIHKFLNKYNIMPTWFEKINWNSIDGFNSICTEFYRGDDASYCWCPIKIDTKMIIKSKKNNNQRKSSTTVGEKYSMYITIVNTIDFLDRLIRCNETFKYNQDNTNNSNNNTDDIEYAIYNLQDRLQMVSIRMESDYLFSNEEIYPRNRNPLSIWMDVGPHLNCHYDENELPDLYIHILYCKFWGDAVDIPITNHAVLKLIQILNKATPAPCQSRSMVEIIPETWSEPGFELVFSSIIRLIIASLLGIYPHCTVKSNYKSRKQIYNRFCLQFYHYTQKNAKEYVDIASNDKINSNINKEKNWLNDWISNNKFMVIYSIREYILFVMDSLSGFKAYMEDNYYWYTMEKNCFEAMDKVRQMMNEQAEYQSSSHDFISSTGEVILEQWYNDHIYYGKSSTCSSVSDTSADKPVSMPAHVNDGWFEILKPLLNNYNEANLMCSYRPISMPFVKKVFDHMQKIEDKKAVVEATTTTTPLSSSTTTTAKPAAKRGRKKKNAAATAATPTPSTPNITVNDEKNQSIQNFNNIDKYMLEQLTSLSIQAGDNTSYEWTSITHKVSIISILFMKEAQRLYETETMRSGIKNICEYLDKNDLRTFKILKTFFATVLKSQSIGIYNLPWYMTAKQIKEYRKEYGLDPGEPLPETAGLFYYCSNCCELKSKVVPNILSITHRDDIKVDKTIDTEITKMNNKRDEETLKKDKTAKEKEEEKLKQSIMKKQNSKKNKKSATKTGNSDNDSSGSGSSSSSSNSKNNDDDDDDNSTNKKKKRKKRSKDDSDDDDDDDINFINKLDDVNGDNNSKRNYNFNGKWEDICYVNTLNSVYEDKNILINKFIERTKLNQQRLQQQQTDNNNDSSNIKHKYHQHATTVNKLDREFLEEKINDPNDTFLKNRYSEDIIYNTDGGSGGASGGVHHKKKIKLLHDHKYNTTGIRSDIDVVDMNKYATSITSDSNATPESSDIQLQSINLMNKRKAIQEEIENKSQQHSHSKRKSRDKSSKAANATSPIDSSQTSTSNNKPTKKKQKISYTSTQSKLTKRAPGKRKRGRKPEFRKKKREDETLFHIGACLDVFTGKIYCAKSNPKKKRENETDVVQDVVSEIIGTDLNEDDDDEENDNNDKKKSSKKSSSSSASFIDIDTKTRKTSSIIKEQRNNESIIKCQCTELTPINMIGRIICIDNKDNDKCGSIFICPWCKKNTFYSRESFIYSGGKMSCGCQAIIPSQRYCCSYCKREIKKQINLFVHAVYDDETDPENPIIKMMIFCQDHNNGEIRRWDKTFLRMSTIRYAIKNRLYSRVLQNGDRNWHEKKKRLNYYHYKPYVSKKNASLSTQQQMINDRNNMLNTLCYKPFDKDNDPQTSFFINNNNNNNGNNITLNKSILSVTNLLLDSQSK